MIFLSLILMDCLSIAEDLREEKQVNRQPVSISMGIARAGWLEVRKLK